MKFNFISKSCFKDINEFVFIKQIGLGSFGKVQLALHVDTNKFYAIKIVSLENQNMDQKQIMLLQREIYLHSEVDHPHIVKLWDTIEDGHNVYLIMQLAQNSSLFSYQSKKKILTQVEAFKFFHQTLKAIEYLHSLNIMHRDIKPQNILLDKNYNVKLCDLGWATQNIHQKRKTFCGTYEYMAPQMVFEKEYDYKIDTWALGVLLYELLHGYAPFKAKNLDQIKQKISKGYYEIDAKFSKELKCLIIDLLQFTPDSRPELGAIVNYEWIDKMKKQVKKQAIRIKVELIVIEQQNSGIRPGPNGKDQNHDNLAKKHKRFESVEQFSQAKTTAAFDGKNKLNCSKKDIQSDQNGHRMKKKCKTQGEESLQKYQTQLLKLSSPKKQLQAGSFMKKKQKQALNTSKGHILKWSNFPEYNNQMSSKQKGSLTKLKKMQQKINEASIRIEKNDKKKIRLKTHNFF